MLSCWLESKWIKAEPAQILRTMPMPFSTFDALMVYLVICLVRDVWLLLKWATSKGADDLKPKVEKGAFTKQPTETTISANFAEIYMLPGPKHKVPQLSDLCHLCM